MTCSVAMSSPAERTVQIRLALAASCTLALLFTADLHAGSALLLGNDHVRVVEYEVRTGQTVRLEAQAPHVFFCLSRFNGRLTEHDGKQADVSCKPEDVRWFGHPARSLVNSGTDDARFLLVEIRKRASRTSAPMRPDDGTIVAPGQYSVLLQNDRVRVIRARIQPGEKTRMHSHPGSGFRYALELRHKQYRFTFPDGSTREGQSEGKEARWSEAPSEHTIENTGRNDLHNLLIEVR